MESTKNSTTPDVEDWDVSFGIPINELKEILNAAELAEEFADDAPKWDDATSETRDIKMMPSTSKQAVPVLNIESSTFANPEGTLDALASLPSKVCDVCHKTFSRLDALLRHKKTHTEKKTHSCDLCKRVFSRKDILQRHRLTHFNLTNQQSTSNAVSKRRLIPSQIPPSKKRKPDNSAHALNVFTIVTFNSITDNELDFLKFFDYVRPFIFGELKSKLEEKKAIKWYAVVQATLTRTTQENDVEYITPYFRSNCLVELMENTIAEHLESAFKKIQNSFEEFTQRGSGWTLDKILKLELNIAKYQPLCPSSYIPLPKKLADKKAILNIKNEDQKCFVWCLLAHKLKIDRNYKANSIHHYIPHESKIKLGNVKCPVPLTSISTLEKLNNVRINVFGFEDEILPLHVSSREDLDCINLLYISNEERQHYCLIRNFSRLIGDLSKHRCKTHICYRCLHRFCREDLLQEHLNYCKNVSPQKIKMPSPDRNLLLFQKIEFQHKVPFIIYADFESILIPYHSAQPTNQSAYTEKIARHKPCGYAYVVIDANGKMLKPITVYRGPDAATHFINNLIKEKDNITPMLTIIMPMNLSPEEEEQFNSETHCYLCKHPLENDKVRDHCHLSGRYRGAAHNYCNLQYKMRKMIPVVFHNLKNYDAHHIIKCLGNFKDYEFNILANNMEKYITFSMKKNVKENNVAVSLQFIDSFQFLPTSLQKLVHNLKDSDFNILKQNVSQNKIQLLLRKGIYPYEYVDNFQKFSEIALPPASAFYSTLSGEHVSAEDYEHAKNVWSTFKIKSLGEYHDLYVSSDVLLLADVFENFRKICLKNYELDPAHLITSPSLAWQACLKMCQQPLELFTSIDMHLFIEKGIRGGISTICKRYARANNRYLENYDPSSPSKYIIYLDANNLYGWAMSQALPYGDFKWISPDTFNKEHILSIPENSEVGYIFEPDGHGYELVSSVRALVPQKFSVEEELMHVKHVEVKSPHVGVMWKFGRGVISSGIVLVT
ncbi:c2H2-type domain-containing protein [Trichonephila clavipes]|nr:c2H2-type domain-containing protein [Trichonephila clavipes]